jgi:hypothetical protein
MEFDVQRQNSIYCKANFQTYHHYALWNEKKSRMCNKSVQTAAIGEVLTPRTRAKVHQCTTLTDNESFAAVHQTFPTLSKSYQKTYHQQQKEKKKYSHSQQTLPGDQKPNEVLPFLWIGRAEHTRRQGMASQIPFTNLWIVEKLTKWRFTHILNVASSDCQNHFVSEYKYHSCPINDMPQASVVPFFDECFDFIGGLQAQLSNLGREGKKLIA